MTGSPLELISIDVSAIAEVRKRVSRAAKAARAVSILLAFQLMGGLENAGVSALASVAALVLAGFVWWVARKLIAGSRPAAWFLGFGCVAAFGCLAVPVYILVDSIVRNPHFCTNLNASGPEMRGMAAGSALFPLAILSLGWILNGVIALLRYPSESAGGLAQAGPLGTSPWEQRIPKSRKPPIFANKHSGAAYVWIAITTALSYIGAAVVVVWLSSVPRSACDLAGAMYSGDAVLYGRAIGGMLTAPVMAILVWLPIILLYRRARRHAMVRASDLAALHPGGFILYLRSFIDDRIKMRARAANGRIWPEMFNKISFEEVITGHLWHYADVRAIGKPADAKGNPADKLAPLGAARDYFPDSAWRDTVVRWMHDAVLICSIAGTGQSYLWEIAAATENNYLSKMIVLFPPAPVIDLEHRWQALSIAQLGLPTLAQANVTRARALVFPNGRALLIQGRVHDDWTYEATMDTAARLRLEEGGQA